jgi:hypothetical protein
MSFFSGSGDQIQGLPIAKQVLYHWAKSPTQNSLLKKSLDQSCKAKYVILVFLSLAYFS